MNTTRISEDKTKHKLTSTQTAADIFRLATLQCVFFFSQSKQKVVVLVTEQFLRKCIIADTARIRALCFKVLLFVVMVHEVVQSHRSRVQCLIGFHSQPLRRGGGLDFASIGFSPGTRPTSTYTYCTAITDI